MKIDAKIRYEEKYLPTKRHRKHRTREVEEPVVVELREVRKEDAPVAMVVTDYQSYIDENGKDQFGLRDKAFLAVAGQLYAEKRDMRGALDEGVYSLEQFMRAAERAGDCHFAWNASKRSKKDMIQSVEDFVNSHVMIDGVIYQEMNEPRYVVMTFGLGHNHGGTALMIETHYNENIGKNNYFSALQLEQAVAYADKVAAARGDTKDVGTFGDCHITVYMPEMVRCNPQMEHGDGDPFMNSLEELVQGSGSVMEAGLLAMAATNAEIHKDDTSKRALADVISEAESQKADPAVEDVSHDFGERE